MVKEEENSRRKIHKTQKKDLGNSQKGGEIMECWYCKRETGNDGCWVRDLWICGDCAKEFNKKQEDK